MKKNNNNKKAENNKLKIYNTANKLFTLSKINPVGIMIYGNAQIMGIPWETIIKEYRRIVKPSFNNLEQYFNDFISFLEKKSKFFSDEMQGQFVQVQTGSYYNLIIKNINKNVQDELQKHGKITENDIKIILREIIKSHVQELEQIETSEIINDDIGAKIAKKYNSFINHAIKDIFGNLPLSRSNNIQLKKIAKLLLIKNINSAGISGIVIAGFGNKEIFPSIINVEAEGIANNKLIYKSIDRYEINQKSSAGILPFAISDDTMNFIEGIHPNQEIVLSNYLKQLFHDYPTNIISVVKKFVAIDTKNEKAISRNLLKLGDIIYSDFSKQMNNYKQENHINPIIGAVASLPKDELAAMAESLVNLTSLRQKFTLDAETVGGPIDVAVITKGDGFIWIKRKHYFSTDFNPHFLANYLIKNKGDENEKE